MAKATAAEQGPLLFKEEPAAQNNKEPSALPFILYYALCSGTMLVINKLAIVHLQSPTFLLLCQLGFTAFFVQLIAAMGWVESTPLEWGKVKKFLPVAAGFACSVFANMKVLQYANVDTFITFRSSTPLVLSICDYLFLGRALPSLKSFMCLLALLVSSVGYVLVDSAFEVRAYAWLLVWYVAFTFDGVYVKHLCNTVQMTDWGRVYYTNFLSLAPLMLIYVVLQEYKVLHHMAWTMAQIGSLTVACILGVAMSHSGYCLRRSVTATMMALVGIICKVLTVVINTCMWSRHASPSGLVFLGLSLLAGTLYEQAPPRPRSSEGHNVTALDPEEGSGANSGSDKDLELPDDLPSLDQRKTSSTTSSSNALCSDSKQ